MIPVICFIVSTKTGVLVKYGLTKKLEMSETKVVSRTYAATDMCARPANETGFWDPGYTYDVLLTKLTPNTRYYYSYGSGEVCSTFFSIFNKQFTFS